MKRTARHQRRNQEHLQEYQQGAQRHVSEVQSQEVARTEQVEALRDALSQFLDEGEHLSDCVPKQADLARPKVHQKFSSRDMSVIH